MIENIDFKREFALGIGIGLLFIVLNATLGLVIGIPLLAGASDSEKLIVRNGIAPVVEEGTFRALLPYIFFL